MRSLILIVAFACVAQAQQPLCPQLEALIADSPAHWGISVATLAGEPLCAIHAAQLFRPASNAKLFTTAAALAVLGPKQTFVTRVTGRLDPATGVVASNLTLVGGGDPSLDSGDLPYRPAATPAPAGFPSLDDLAAQLVRAGVKSVAGDLIGDDSYFPYEPYAASWELDDLVWGYGAPISALTIGDNQLRLTVTPAAEGSSHQANASLDQRGIGFYTVVSQLQTVPPEQATGVNVERLPGSRTLRVTGSIAAGAKPDVEEVAIDDPAEFAALAFRDALLRAGIRVAGKVRSAHGVTPDNGNFLKRLRETGGIEENILAHKPIGQTAMATLQGPTLATLTSQPLAADIFFTNKTSQNLHAELLLHHLGRAEQLRGGSTLEGERMLRAFLPQTGVQPDDVLLSDGSGLSSHDLVTPRSLTQLLTYAATQPWFADFKASLPIGGVDGSLAHRFPGALKGRVLAKTGTLGESRALSGYLTAASGQTLVFSILVDNHPPGTASDRTLMDQIVEQIAAVN